MSSLLDTLNPASPPVAKGAREVRPLDRKAPLPVAVIDGESVFPPPQPVTEPAPAKVTPTTKASPVNSKSASIRALLRDHPEGLGYDGLCKGTGIARDKIASHLSNLLIAGDIKGYELNDGRGRVFKITGTGTEKVGERTVDQAPAKASIAASRSEGTQGTGLPEAGRSRRADAAASPGRPAASAATTSTAADRKPADRSSPPATDRAPVPAATPQPAAPETSVSARPDPAPSLAGGGSTRAADHEPEAPQSPEPVRAGADPISAATSARAPANDGAHALAVELVCIAAKNAIAEVRASFAGRELHRTWPELADALANFERADRIYVSTKGRT